MKPWVTLFFVLFNYSVSLAQEYRISTSVGLTRFDYFHSVDASLQHKKWELSTGFAYGINRTYFQQRFFPKVQLQTGYDFIHKPKFELGTCIYTSFSWLKVNKASKHFTNWSEFFGGLSWSYGGKWKVGQTITAGYFTESNFSTLIQKRDRVGNWGYFFNLQLIHVL